MTMIALGYFLDRYPSRLQRLELANTPFPALLKLLLSAPDLVHRIWNVPNSGLILPKASAAFLEAMEQSTSWAQQAVVPMPPACAALCALYGKQKRSVTKFGLEIARAYISKLTVPFLERAVCAPLPSYYSP